MTKNKPAGCDLCSDNTGPMHVRSRCHMTAPLRAEIWDGVITLFCYVPTCNRVVSQMRITAIEVP